MVEQAGNHQTDGGSKPTPSLQDLWVESCSSKQAAKFVEEHHYTHSAKGMTPKYSYSVLNKTNNKILGVAIFGIPGQKQTLERYNWILDSNGQKQIINMVELRRLVLLDEAPKNSESLVLGRMLKLLKKEGVHRILSYADPNQKRTEHPDGEHTGLIYRAVGFHKVKSAGKTKAIWWKGRRYPIRNLDQYNNYHSKPPNWDDIPEEKKILREENYRGKKRLVWVPKIPSERIGIAKQLVEAIEKNEAHLVSESGKIGYIKDLVKGMPYFETPNHKKRRISEKSNTAM